MSKLGPNGIAEANVGNIGRIARATASPDIEPFGCSRCLEASTIGDDEDEDADFLFLAKSSLSPLLLLLLLLLLLFLLLLLLLLLLVLLLVL